MSRIVLLVEEDAAVAEMISEALHEQAGCAVLWVREHHLALLLLQHQFHPHHIVLDLGFPYAPGLAFHDQLQRDPATAAIPLVALAAHPTHQALAAHRFAAVLPKPFDLAMLAQVLDLPAPPPGDGTLP